MFKLVVVLMLLAVIGSLFAGLFFLYRDRDDGHRTVRALTLRVVLSLAVLALLLLGYRFGLIPGRLG